LELFVVRGFDVARGDVLEQDLADLDAIAVAELVALDARAVDESAVRGAGVDDAVVRTGPFDAGVLAAHRIGVEH
jgi:hypothetical protein